MSGGNMTQDTTLAATLMEVEKLNWIHDPRGSLEQGLAALLAVERLPLALGERLKREGARSSAAHKVHELVTRTDILLCSSPTGSVDLWLHVNRRGSLTRESKFRPHIASRGHWQGTIVIDGRLTRSRYRYHGPRHEIDWFPKDNLRRVDRQEYRAGEAFISQPEDVYGWDLISAQAVTVTIDVNHGAVPYHVFIRQLNHYSHEIRQPRSHRMLELANRLLAITPTAQPR